MSRSESIATMVCTAGQGVTDRIKEMFAQGDPVAGHILDTIGSQVAECIADRVQAILETEMKSTGKSITNRYSPGYCFWPVSEQHLFFSLLPEKFCGVTLTESALMVPIKSISAIVGIGAEVAKHDYECGACDQMDCIRRQQMQ
jgi:cobalamin-dependent methionine synthase I